MEIYKDLDSAENQQFEKLLNSQLSKNKIEEGKIIDGKITKITDKFVFIFIAGLKSEPIIDTNELKMIGLKDKIEIGQNIPVLLEKIEDRNGEVVVSALKAQKIKGCTKEIRKGRISGDSRIFGRYYWTYFPCKRLRKNIEKPKKNQESL